MNDVPLVKDNKVNDINTSIIAIKKQLKQLNEALGLIDVPNAPDLSPYVRKDEVVDVVESGNMNPVTSNAVVPVDEVTSGNMHSVTSNAVVVALNEVEDYSDISGGGQLYIKRYGKVCFLTFRIAGDNTTRMEFAGKVPSKYRPDSNGVRGVVFDNSIDVPFGQGIISSAGNIVFYSNSAFQSTKSFAYTATYIIP